MEISVLQWNIWYHENLANVADFLHEQQADVICLQEMPINSRGQTEQDGPAYLAERLGYQYFGKGLPLENTDGKPAMWADGILSRFPILEKRWVWTNEPRAGGGYGDEYRTYVEVILDVTGRELVAGTTHMSYTHRFEDTPAKQRETARLVQEVSRRAAEDRPFIFTGDLNATPGSPAIDAVSRVLHHAGPDMKQKTWTTKPFAYNGFEETELAWRLDYVFVNKALRVQSSEVLQTEYSDHLPILTKILI